MCVPSNCEGMLVCPACAPSTRRPKEPIAVTEALASSTSEEESTQDSDATEEDSTQESEEKQEAAQEPKKRNKGGRPKGTTNRKK